MPGRIEAASKSWEAMARDGVTLRIWAKQIENENKKE